jgi:hypothetical protein
MADRVHVTTSVGPDTDITYTILVFLLRPYDIQTFSIYARLSWTVS